MGSVANKIARKFHSSLRGSNVVDLADWREGKKMALEADFDPEGPLPEGFAGLDPWHGIYMLMQNITECLGTPIAKMKEAKDFVRIALPAEERYMPDGPPTSPLTVSYFTMWSTFDVQFGSSRETIGSCILRIAPQFDFPSWLIETVEWMQRSRMGFYVHCGGEGDTALLREVGTQKTLSCMVPSGYVGREGEIWFVRVLPLPHRLCPRHIVFNTPYVIKDWPESAFIDYLERELARMTAKRPLRTDDLHGQLMKYGPHPNYWNEYIWRAYKGYEYEVIFLTGIPDIEDSLPYAPPPW